MSPSSGKASGKTCVECNDNIGLGSLLRAHALRLHARAEKAEAEVERANSRAETLSTRLDAMQGIREEYHRLVGMVEEQNIKMQDLQEEYDFLFEWASGEYNWPHFGEWKRLTFAEWKANHGGGRESGSQPMPGNRSGAPTPKGGTPAANPAAPSGVSPSPPTAAKAALYLLKLKEDAARKERDDG